MGGYWLEPDITASAALARTASGPGPSGNPWPRLMAPVSRAMADMASKMVVGRPAKMGLGIGEMLCGLAPAFAEMLVRPEGLGEIGAGAPALVKDRPTARRFAARVPRVLEQGGSVGKTALQDLRAPRFMAGAGARRHERR